MRNSSKSSNFGCACIPNIPFDLEVAAAGFLRVSTVSLLFHFEQILTSCDLLLWKRSALDSHVLSASLLSLLKTLCLSCSAFPRSGEEKPAGPAAPAEISD